MPRLVDHDVRRRQLAEAVWRVVTRDGIDAASVRGVAREAGASMGSLRHYFASQTALLAFAMRLVTDRVERRVSALLADGPPSATALVHEALPLDSARQVENEVWIAFTARSLVDRTLRDLRAEAHAGLRALCRRAVEARCPGRAGDGIDLAAEAERLHALVDGLALHAALDPDRATPARLVALVDRHLDELGPG